jgi:hypothetical protein
MRCEAFADVVHDLGRFAALDRKTREEALAHAQSCSRCAALKDAVETLETSLAALGLEDERAKAPERVEAVLRAAFRANRPRILARPVRVAWTWGLATAATLGIGVLAWQEWKSTPKAPVGKGSVLEEAYMQHAPAISTAAPQPGAQPAADSASDSVLDASGFLPLPYGAAPAADEQADVVRVRMARGSLAAFGLPVDGERVDELIDVDLLVGEDGTPQAVRLSD